jgi:SAM-dependent methyltransferase
VTDYALRLSEDEIARYRMMAERAQAQESDEWDLAGIHPGARVADVGCGPGALLPLISALVGPEGRVAAIDGDPQAVAAAEELVRVAGLANVTVAQGRAEDTGLEAGAFDTVTMRHVLAHNGSAAQAIVDHLATLVRPGGHVVLVDIDGTAFRMRPAEPAFTEMMERYGAFQEARGGDMQVGLRLDVLLQEAGLELLTYRGLYDVFPLPPGLRGPAWAARDAMVQAGFATQDDLDRWDARYREREASGQQTTLFAARFVAVGRKLG